MTVPAQQLSPASVQRHIASSQTAMISSMMLKSKTPDTYRMYSSNSKIQAHAAFKPSPEPLLALPAPHPATTPPQDILEQTPPGTTPTTTKTVSPSTKDSSEGSEAHSKATKKTTKRELFQDNEATEKKPRQET
ncbi:hypothetical protein Tco_1491855 [Tanacetum coccineum]